VWRPLKNVQYLVLKLVIVLLFELELLSIVIKISKIEF